MRVFRRPRGGSGSVIYPGYGSVAVKSLPLYAL